MLEIFSVFPSSGIVGCFVFAFLLSLFLLVGLGSSLFTPCIPLGVLVPSFGFNIIVYQSKKKNRYLQAKPFSDENF